MAEQAGAATYRDTVSAHTRRSRVGGSGFAAYSLTAAALACCVSGCGVAAQPVKGATVEAPVVRTLELGIANVHVVIGTRVILFDSGAESTVDDVMDGLKALGIGPSDVSLIVASHGHADHAGGAFELKRRTGAPILMGAGDADMAAKGTNRPLQSMRFFASVLRVFLSSTYPRFMPDLVLTEAQPTLDLRDYGVAGTAVLFPGHTRGSVAVRLPNHKVLAGDLMLGGAFGGAVCATSPGEHYYHEDRAQVRRNIVDLLRSGARTFYLGHGGPVGAHDVLKALKSGEFGDAPRSAAPEASAPSAK